MTCNQLICKLFLLLKSVSILTEVKQQRRGETLTIANDGHYCYHCSSVPALDLDSVLSFIRINPVTDFQLTTYNSGPMQRHERRKDDNNNNHSYPRRANCL